MSLTVPNAKQRSLRHMKILIDTREKINKRARERYKRFGHYRRESKCIVCGKVWMSPRIVRRYCSKKCQSGGKHNGRWKGGRNIRGDGYVEVWNGINQRYTLEHNLKIESLIGRRLKKFECVHHVNEIRKDNRLCNLVLMTISDHTKYHWDKWKAEGGSPVEVRVENTLRYS